MMQLLNTTPETLRLTAFLSLFALLAVCEALWPRRPLTVSKSRRWLGNLVIVTLDALLLRLLLPLAPFGLAAMAQTNGWGLFNRFGVHGWPELLASLLLLDLIIYFQHRLFHRTPLFWRFHRMHHTDLDLDVSSGIRFHPVEIALSLLIKMAAVLLLGVAPLSVLLFEILLNATSMFSHTNMRLPLGIDRWLRLFVVTPDMHRVHHSVIPRETDSNFGFNLPWWDRLFNTYRAQPREGHDLMAIGLREFRELDKLGLRHLLLLPFISTPARKPL
ncbi:MAG: sterol desaturase family protein [Deltaproteobacteria bacterium]|nr:sterol desaturase family protein [Deltaproteobacteria bacterium]